VGLSMYLLVWTQRGPQRRGRTSQSAPLVNELGLRDADQVLEMGRPAGVIGREAAERNADLIVRGWHGHLPAICLLIGSSGARTCHSSRLARLLPFPGARRRRP
jgi:nucleotide-binding universal stress UspA family protein